jgi:pseudouridine synthase
VGSRRACEALIAAGRIAINDRVVSELGVTVDPRADTVRVEGRAVAPQRRMTILFNKPRDVLCTCRDPRQRRTFRAYLPNLPVRLFPIGRLDRNSEGLLLLTNDGNLAHLLMHPRHAVPKTYRVWIRGALSAEDQARLRRGVESEGEILNVDDVTLVEKSPDHCCYRVVLRAGRNRHIRRLLEALGHAILRLKRTAIGPLELRELRVGQWRHLTDEEIRLLRSAATRSSPSTVSSKETHHEKNRRHERRNAAGYGRRRSRARSSFAAGSDGGPR